MKLAGNFVTLRNKKNETEMRTKLHYCSPGGCCWAAFLKDGALRENSPNHMWVTLLLAV